MKSCNQLCCELWLWRKIEIERDEEEAEECEGDITSHTLFSVCFDFYIFCWILWLHGGNMFGSRFTSVRWSQNYCILSYRDETELNIEHLVYCCLLPMQSQLNANKYCESVTFRWANRQSRNISALCTQSIVTMNFQWSDFRHDACHFKGKFKFPKYQNTSTIEISVTATELRSYLFTR